VAIRILFSVGFLAVILSVSTAQAGKTYVWTDENGVTQITDTPPPAKYQKKPKPKKTETERKAAAGDTNAQFFLKYQKDAIKGDVEARYKLGMMYLNGRGVAKDQEEANSWLTLAAAAGHEKAKEELESINRRQQWQLEAAIRETEAERKRPKLKTGAVLCQIKPWLNDWITMDAARDTDNKDAYLKSKKCRYADSRDKFTLAGVYTDGSIAVIIEGDKYWGLATAIK
ncbi:MAG: DUF4124 domain-containing protein, partial [Gemmatimonadota bacterium]|nr:DUF4124 domain-containing protein [Gemmatimonadota bacterium]